MSNLVASDMSGHDWLSVKAMLVKRFGKTQTQVASEMFSLRQGITPVKEYVDKQEYLVTPSALPDTTPVTAPCNGLNQFSKSAFVTHEATRAA